jgi:hypothetical protein
MAAPAPDRRPDDQGGHVLKEDRLITSERMPAPRWVPRDAVHYLTHTAQGRSIREIARATGCHASTISRRIRRFETRRDDPLVDDALDRIGTRYFPYLPTVQSQKETGMPASTQMKTHPQPEDRIEHESLLALRRLAETGAVLAVAQDLDNAVVVRELPGGKTARTAVVARATAEAMALNEWIACDKPGKIARYSLTSVGRAALKRRMSREESAGFAEAPQAFSDQHRQWGMREVPEPDEDRIRRVRCNLAESPLTLLARLRDRSGKAFLGDDLVAAGERLREDFELSQMGPRVAQNWDRFLTAGARSEFGNAPMATGSGSARERVGAALQDLGPGLADVALRCCCFLEGIETTEREMGWSARSGKVVLRIALQRLALHYGRLQGGRAMLIG